jgi:putative Mg2+ transporter-C (MgtC) family protein
MAGTRTNALVAAGAAAFTMAGHLLVGDGSGEARVVSYVVSGVGFLGTGVIFKEGANIQGLNTAATVWCSAAVGILAGMGFADLSLVTVLAVIVTNATLRQLTYKLRPELKPQATDYHFELVCSGSDEGHIRALLLNDLDHARLTLTAVSREDLEQSGRVQVSADLKASSRCDDCLEKLVTRISLESSVTAVRWQITR